ncbi:hypothetical protein CLV28_0704 [Sediminihabitans luteus]|uniref:Scaffolding protein n=1 Tax=Sediminihabitans luteus TaxID=1138585 RepID=A0A2M9D081_9CELL|nr:hypothetical protein [Sediminihabitans luteus]PJJ77485.1 hypothetical protein CLV28_0704 [Sediminihabitans luteus]GII98381.1 hypothetical protein Slu03_07590 [Sediminihabitans luteus]
MRKAPTMFPILPTPGLSHPRFTRLRFITDGATDGTPGATPSTEPKGDDTGTPSGQDSAGADAPKTYDEAYVAKLREENAANRVKARDAETAATTAAEAKIKAALEALGIKPDGDDTDPVKLAEKAAAERDAATAQARAAQVELAVYRAASTANADATALLDSNSFLATVRDIDPTDSEAIVAAIKTATSTNPRLRATQAVGASSVDHAGGTGEGAITAEKFAAMTPADKNDLFRKNPTLYRQLTGR